MYITVEHDKVHCECEVKWSCEVNSKVHKVPYLLVNHWFRFYVKFSIIYIKDKIYEKKISVFAGVISIYCFWINSYFWIEYVW